MSENAAWAMRARRFSLKIFDRRQYSRAGRVLNVRQRTAAIFRKNADQTRNRFFAIFCAALFLVT
jgi:hypothetical protein